MTRINLVDPSELSEGHLTKETILEALALHNFYKKPTAEYLKIKRSKLYTLLRKYDIFCEKRTGVVAIYKINNETINNMYYKLLNRCTNKNAPDYKYYGERGISVYKPWIENRDLFSEYVASLENFGINGYSLDRIDNSQGYFPGNLRFSTAKQQCNNRRSNKIIEHNGETMTLTQFCDRYCKHYTFDYVSDRLDLGFTLQEVLDIPKGVKRKTYYKNLTKE